MSFADPTKSIGWSNQEFVVNEIPMTLKTITSWSGGGFDSDATHVFGAGKHPLEISEGTTTPSDITFDIQETEWINLVEALGGYEAVQSSAGTFTITRTISNGQQTQKWVFVGCRVTSGPGASAAHGGEASMVSVTVKCRQVKLNDSSNSALLGTLLGKTADKVTKLVSSLL